MLGYHHSYLKKLYRLDPLSQKPIIYDEGICMHQTSAIANSSYLSLCLSSGHWHLRAHITHPISVSPLLLLHLFLLPLFVHVFVKFLHVCPVHLSAFNSLHSLFRFIFIHRGSSFPQFQRTIVCIMNSFDSFLLIPTYDAFKRILFYYHLQFVSQCLFVYFFHLFLHAFFIFFLHLM